METVDAYKRLIDHGIRPSIQRIVILDYLLKHATHPTVDDVYKGMCDEIPTLSKTTVYNTLRMLADNHVVQMITIDDHRVCYDGNQTPHVHFFCKKCGRVFDLFNEPAPTMSKQFICDGHLVDEKQLYYKGICKDCLAKEL
ncbi:MAG: Fur family transcriptional regulator [Prevotella sp.]|jgi:Fur family peroxide stress response transcriptional regulator